MSNKPPVIKNTVKLTDSKWLNMYQANVERSDGSNGTWFYVSRKDRSLVGDLDRKPDAIIIVPLLKKGRDRELVVIKEYRIPIQGWEYGFPAGLIEVGEDIQKVAKRELKEETGLKLTKILYAGKPCFSSAGLSDESVVYVVCECEGTVSTEGNEVSESIEVETLGIEQIQQLLNSQELVSAKFTPFLLLFSALKKVAWPKHLRQEPIKKPKENS